MPEGAHPLPPLKGWGSIPFAELDGANWTLGFAAKLLDVPEKELRKRVKEEGLQPAGVINMRPFRSQGRAARAYPAGELIRISEAITEIRETRDFPAPPASA